MNLQQAKQEIAQFVNELGAMVGAYGIKEVVIVMRKDNDTVGVLHCGAENDRTQTFNKYAQDIGIKLKKDFPGVPGDYYEVNPD